MTGLGERFQGFPVPVRFGFFAAAAAAVFVVAGGFPVLLPWDWPWTRVGNAGVATVGMLLVTYLFIKLDGLDGLNGLGAKAIGVAIVSGSAGRLLLGVGIGAALFGVHLSVITIFSGGLSFEFNPDVGFIYVGGAVTAYMLMSSMEEIAFRGYGMRLLDRRYGLWVTQIVIAALFVIYHIAGGQDWLSALVGTGLGGLLFGMAAMASRGLALPTGLHAAWNFTDWLVGGREHAGAWTLVIDEALAPRVQMVAHTSYIVVFIAATVGFWWWYRNRVEAAPV